MTDHKGSDLEALCARVARRVPALGREMVRVFVQEVPYYRRLPQEELDGDITAISTATVRALVEAVRQGRGPTEQELDANRTSAASRAREALPLEALLGAYLVGGRLVWRELVEQARPEELPALLRAADLVQLFVQRVTGTVATAYLGEQQLIASAEHDTRRELARALLDGAPSDDLAARAGTDVHRPWTVLALVLDAHADEARPDTDGTVAARRKVRRVQDVLDALPGPVLALLDTHGGRVLLPGSVAVEPLVRDLRVVAGVAVRAGVAGADGPEQLPAAGQLASELAPLGGAEPARLETHALTYQLTRPGPALPVLRAALDPLRADLRETVRTFLACDLDRQRTAAALHVHPNTLDHRLRRVAALTGHAVSTTSGLLALAAGLAAQLPSDRPPT